MSINLNRPKSQSIYQRLCEVIPGGVNSPVRACKGIMDTPFVVERASGDMIYDADGHAFIDFCGSWGALIHGHANPDILNAAKSCMDKGTSFGITTEIEEKIARKITSKLDSIEKIRFVSSGTEASMSAIRLARGFTGRELIVKFAGNYHGHADHFLVQAGSGVLNLSSTSSSAGIPNDLVKHTISLPYNDVEACRSFLLNPTHSKNIAAVIIEPVSGNMGVVPAKPEFIHMLKEVTEKIGAILILDEVITGYRVALKGAQSLYGIKPDMTCLGKIIGGGFPAAAFGGKREIMDCLAPLGGVYQAGTLSGNPVAMAAGLKALEMVEQPKFYEELCRKTKIITEPVKEFIKSKKINACVQESGSMFTLFFGLTEVNNLNDSLKLDLEKFSRFFRHMLNKGIYIPPSQHEALFVSAAHTDKHLEMTRDAILEVVQ